VRRHGRRSPAIETRCSSWAAKRRADREGARRSFFVAPHATADTTMVATAFFCFGPMVWRAARVASDLSTAAFVSTSGPSACSAGSRIPRASPPDRAVRDRERRRVGRPDELVDGPIQREERNSERDAPDVQRPNATGEGGGDRHEVDLRRPDRPHPRALLRTYDPYHVERRGRDREVTTCGNRGRP
jgi:hypothetical protein